MFDSFVDAAKSLSRNPLGIIGLFAVLVFGMATLLISAQGEHLSEMQRTILTIFLVSFPVLVLGVFTFLVSRHPEKLYSPSDFKDESNFLRKLSPADQKQRLEEAADQLEAGGIGRQGLPSSEGYRSLTRGEVKRTLSLADDLALRALEAEFGCSIEREVGIEVEGGGWINFDGAIARGEELVGIDLHYYKGGDQIAFFQIDALLELLESQRFVRFRRVSLFLVIVSEATDVEDLALEVKLQELVGKFRVRTHLRFFRLNKLKNQFGL